MRALVLNERDGVVELITAERPEPTGEVVIDVERSALNFKDTLVAQPRSRVRRANELVLGCEATGVVRTSLDPRFAPGDAVVVYGGGIGVSVDGGFATALAAPAAVVAPRAATMDATMAMAYGLAAHTALASLWAVEATMTIGEPLLITGASGGVGSLCVLLAARRGHHVIASSGSDPHHGWLVDHGAAAVIGRDEIGDREGRVLGTERWAGAIDCIGGSTLHQILRTLGYGRTVAASGLVRGAQLEGDLYPFITRAVRLVGIDVVECPNDQRRKVWEELGALVRADDVDLVERTIGLGDVHDALTTIREGRTRGRWLVDPRR